MKMNKPDIINLPKFLDARGNLSFVEQDNHIPFTIRRTYWLYDVPGGECRGGHAYKDNEEFIVALSGSFDVILDSYYSVLKKPYFIEMNRKSYKTPYDYQTRYNFKYKNYIHHSSAPIESSSIKEKTVS